MVTFEDKTTTITNTRKQVGRKTPAPRSNELRGTLKPLWNIIPDGTITKYTPTTLTLDTHNRKSTVIRKNDLDIVNETKPRLIHFVACKTVREYKRNQEKIKEFLLTEKKTNKKTQPKDKQKECIPGPSTQMDQPGPMDQPGEAQGPHQAKHPRQPKRKGTAPTKRGHKPNKNFDQRSKDAALAQSKLEKARQRQKDKINSPRIHLDTKRLYKDRSVEVINFASDSSHGSPLQIFTSDNPNAFMYGQPSNRDNSPTKRDAKIDKIIRRITNSPKKTQVETEYEQIITIIPASKSTPIGNNTKTLQSTDNKQAPQPTGDDNKEKPQKDMGQQISKSTGSDNKTQQHNNTQTSTLPNDNIQTLQQINKELTETPEERQETNTEMENIHREDPQDDYSGSSSISSINAADREALNKIFD